ncbi:MAG: SspB family protein [Rhizobiaceae bacterium]|nr:SspB family protein [Rhizobiaceae bacterium]MCV0405187.1 SspB family protein [Rhizobiaceae bacterium]
MTDDQIRYDILAQEALRGVMRKVLAEVARAGLPGNHHFFITFLTGAPGVRISTRLRERYPEQMTIVLQYQYWDLKVTETGFEVTLSFSDVPEKLEIPFSAVRGFYDPSVNFELEFDVKPDEAAPGAEIATLPAAAPPAPVAVKPVESADEPRKKPAARKDAAKADAKSDAGTEPAKSGEVVSLDSFRKR